MERMEAHKAARLIISKAKLQRGARLEAVAELAPDTDYYWSDGKRCGTCRTDALGQWAKGAAPGGQESAIFRLVGSRPHGMKEPREP